jgi:hypothetical protein
MENDQNGAGSSPSLKELAFRAAPIAQNSSLLEVNLRSLEARLEDEPVEPADLELGAVHRVERFFTPENEKDPARLSVRVHFLVEVRTTAAKAQVFGLRAAFDARYQLNRGMPTEAEAMLDAFAQTNAVIHVWPYFRELVQSTLWRTGLPPFPLPLFRITDERPASSREGTET